MTVEFTVRSSPEVYNQPMKIEMMQTSRLVEYANNPRRNDLAVDAVMASIKELGFRQPIVCDESLTVLVGHTRLKAARKLGLATVPVHVAVGLSEAQQRAYRIADNRVGDIATFDEELLAIELEELRMADFDLGTMGFDDGEVDALLAVSEPESSSKEIDPDDYQMGCKCPRCGFEFDDKNS